MVPWRRVGQTDRGAAQQGHEAAAGQLLEVHHQVVALAGDAGVIAQLREKIRQGLPVQGPDAADVRVVFEDGDAFLLGEDVDGRVGVALVQEADGRRGQQHVADLAQLADEDALGPEGAKVGHGQFRIRSA